MGSTSSNLPTSAVVVGLCTHGLAIARSLGRKGIRVVTLESNRHVPGRRTRFAEVVHAADINGPPLIDELVRLREHFQESPALFVTNDNMVRVLADGYREIESRYRIRWPDPAIVRQLLDKQEIESIARSCGLAYPRSILVSTVSDLERHRDALRYPMAFKPTKPLSGFKAMKAENEAELVAMIRRFEGSIGQFLVQEWVTGMEPSIYFANFYFDQEHRPLASFVGRKVRAYPRNLGGACSAEPANRPDIEEEALRFFRNVPVRGPASLEIKEDESGRRFVIEPTIGRFDFYILCCIANGVDFPYLSYLDQIGATLPHPPVQSSGRGTMWVDFKSDFPALVTSWGIPGVGREVVDFVLRRKVFAMWAWDDPWPTILDWPQGLGRLLGRVASRAARLWAPRSGRA